MNQYFYVGNDGQQKGPVSGECLKNYGVTKDTLVWCNTLPGWTKASEVQELAPFFAAPQVPPIPVVPPIPAAAQTPVQQTYNVPETCPDNHLIWAILTTIFCCFPFGIPAIVYSAQVDSRWSQGDKVGAKQKAENAKKWCWISFGVAIGCWVIYWILYYTGSIDRYDMLDDLYYYY